MAWAGGVWNTGGTSTDSIGMGMQTYYDKQFLSTLKDELYMWQFGQKRPIPANGGKIIRFFRYQDIANVTAKLTEGTNPDATTITGTEVNRTLEEWGAFSQHSSLISRTHIDAGLTQVSKLWGAQAGRSIDLRTMKEVVTNGCHTMRSDCAANVTYPNNPPGVLGPFTIGDTTQTTLVAKANYAALTDNVFIGGHMTFTSGLNYGQSRYISDNASAAALSSISVVLPWENTPVSGDTFIISHPGISTTTLGADALDATDVITHKAMTKLWEALKVQKTVAYSGGYNVLILGPTTHAGFLSDGTFIPIQQYAGGGALLSGEIGRYMGFRIVTTTQPFRCVLPTTATTGGPGQTSSVWQTSGANYSVSGTGHYSLAFGQEAFGVTNLPGFSSPKIIIKTPGPNDTSNPLNRFSTVGWEMPFVPCALNALWCVGLVSGS
jgi:hypothetical protein